MATPNHPYLPGGSIFSIIIIIYIEPLMVPLFWQDLAQIVWPQYYSHLGFIRLPAFLLKFFAAIFVSVGAKVLDNDNLNERI